MNNFTIVGFGLLLIVLILQVQLSYQFISQAILLTWKATADGNKPGSSVTVNVNKRTGYTSAVLFFSGVISIIIGLF